MKKIFISFITAALLFSACSSNNEDQDTPGSDKTGSLAFEVQFEGIGIKAPKATGRPVPITTWANVEQVQMFVYKKSSNEIVYSRILTKAEIAAEPTKKFKWLDIPASGTTESYDITIVANVKSSSDNVDTALDINGNGTFEASEKVMFGDYNVRNKKVNTGTSIYLKQTTFPAAATHPKWDVTGKTAYNEVSEIFTATVQNIQVLEGATTVVNAPFKLLREVGMLRVRINKKASFLSTLNFAHATNLVAIYKQPVGFELKTQAAPISKGGITAATSNPNHVVVVSGATVFKTANPATTAYTDAAAMIDANFTLWNDIKVLPNRTKDQDAASGATNNDDADNTRKYYVLLSAHAPIGYKLANGTLTTVAGPVYWWTTIQGVLVANVIREVNITISSEGSITPPINPTTEGGLTITLEAPQSWNTNVEVVGVEV